MIWFTADTHFTHANVIKFCKRPFKHVHEMDEELIRRWNERVKPEDTIYIIGDFIWRGGKGFKRQIINRLNGNKILILGNHDGKTEQPKSYLNMGYKEVYSHHTTINIEGQEILLCHYPYNPMLSRLDIFFYKFKHFWKWWRKDKYPYLKHMEKRPFNSGLWLLCGHVHDKWKFKDKMINVGVDVWEFEPVSIREIERIICENSVI